MHYFQTGLLLRLVAELAAVEALLVEDTPDRLDIRELCRPVRKIGPQSVLV